MSGLAPGLQLPGVPQDPPQRPRQGPELSPDLQAAQATLRSEGARMQEQRRQELLAGFGAAIQGDPAFAARASKIARRMGVDPSTYTDDAALKVAEAAAQENDLLSFYAEHPMLDAVMRDVHTVRMLRDDVGNLKQTSDTFDWWRRSVETGAATNEAGYLKAKVGVGIPLSMAETARLRELKDIEMLAGGETGVLAGTANLLGQMAKPALAATATGLTVGLINPVAGAIAAGSVIFGQTAVVEFGHEYESIHDTLSTALKDQGMDPDAVEAKAHAVALRTAAAYAVVAGATEVAGDALFAAPFVRAGKLLARRAAGKAIAQITAGAALRRAAGEAALGFIGEVGTEGLQEVESAIAENVAGKAAGTGTGPTVSETVARSLDVMGQMAQGMLLVAPFGPMIHYVSESKQVAEAQANQAFFQRLAKNAEESKLRQRDPDTYAKVVGSMAQAPHDTVFVQGSKLAAALEQSGITREALRHDLPDVARQLDESERQGGETDVRIPTGDYAAHIAASPAGPMLMQSIRTDPNGYSMDEATAWLSERKAALEAAAKTVVRSQAEQDQWRIELRAIEDRVRSEVAPSPALTPQDADTVAKLHSLFVEVNAAATGVTPAAFDAANPISFRTAAAADTTARGGFDQTTGAVTLLQKHDATTFAHELSHYWFATYMRMASDPAVSQRVAADAQTLLDWVGVKDVATWNAMDLDAQRAAHEQFAHNAELYLHEGKIPAVTKERLSMARRVARWFRRAYRSIRDEINTAYREKFGKDLPALTPEVRAVFDRMLASEETIAAVEARDGFAPLFTEKPEGVSDVEWDGYQHAVQDAHDASTERLQADSLATLKWLRNMRGAFLSALQKEAREARAKIHAEEMAAAQKERVYVARRVLIRGEGVEPDGTVVPANVPKLNTEDARRILTEQRIGGDLKDVLRGITAKDGVAADALAPVLGYDNGEELVRDLATAPALDATVEDRTDQRMLAEHEDLSSPERIRVRAEDATEAAMHDRTRTKMVAAELRWLGRLTTPISVMIRAARAAAHEIVSRTLMREVDATEHAGAERKARVDTDKARKRGDLVHAAKMKRRELLEGQIVVESREVEKEIDKARKLVRQMFKRDAQVARMHDMKYVDAGRALAAAFGLARTDADPMSFVQQLREYDPEVFASIAPAFERAQQWVSEAQQAGRTVHTWQDLTVDEFRDLHDALATLWNTSIRVKQVRIAGKKMQLAEATDQLLAQLAEGPAPRARPAGAPTRWERSMEALRKLGMFARRAENWFYTKDQGRVGAFTKLGWRPIRDAVDHFLQLRNVYTRKVSGSFAALRPTLRKGTIDFTASDGTLLYTFGRGNGGRGQLELLGAMQHTGNASNLRKLLLGRGWATLDEETGEMDARDWFAFVDRMVAEGYVTKQGMDFVQALWDVNEEIKPLTQAAHYELFGHYYKEVPSSPLSFPFGNYRGGYMPASLDATARSSARLRDLKEVQQDFRQQYASTGRGFTKGRVEFNEPLSLDLNLSVSHIDDALRFATIQPAVADAQRMLKQRDVADALDALQPGVWNEFLLPWLSVVASQSTSRAGMSRTLDAFAAGARRNAGLALMFGNVANGLQQLTGVFFSALRVAPRYLFSGFWRMVGSPRETMRAIAAASPYMEERQKGQIHELRETIRKVVENDGALKTGVRWLQRHAYFLQTGLQNWVDGITWQGAFEQAMAEQGRGVDLDAATKEATKRADAAVRMTQGSFDPTDMARYEVGTPGWKLLTQFSGFFNMVANLHADEFQRIARTQGFGKARRAFMLYVFGFLVPMLMADAITKTLRGQWDDDDKDRSVDVWTLDFLFMGQLRNLLAEVPVLGQNFLVPAISGFDNKEWNDRMLTAPAIELLERGISGTERAISHAGDPAKGIDTRDVGDVTTLLSVIFGAPLTAAQSRISYLHDINRGKVRPLGTIDYLRGLATGASSKQSRVR